MSPGQVQDHQPDQRHVAGPERRAGRRSSDGLNSQICSMAYISAQFGRANLKMASIDERRPGDAAGQLVQRRRAHPGRQRVPERRRQPRFGAVGVHAAQQRRRRSGPHHQAGCRSTRLRSRSTCATARRPTADCVRIYDTWNGDPQKFLISDAGNSNMKLTMKLNTNKCIGPRANGTLTPGTLARGAGLQQQLQSGLDRRPDRLLAPASSSSRTPPLPNLCMDVNGLQHRSTARRFQPSGKAPATATSSSRCRRAR